MRVSRGAVTPPGSALLEVSARKVTKSTVLTVTR
jgi:hypothetical protein